MSCLSCGASIGADDVNVSEGVAFCRGCGHLSRLSEIIDAAPARRDDVDISQPPKGCEIQDNGLDQTVRASARNLGAAFGGLFAALFWNGITGVFVLIAIAGTWYNLFGDVPTWFPAPDMADAGDKMPLGMVLFLWVFLTPFMLIGAFLFAGVFTSLLGRVEVRRRGREAVIFTGFGPFGWKRRLKVAEIKSIGPGRTTWKENNRSKPVIAIETKDKTFRLGSVLPASRREWMLAALRTTLLDR